MISITDAFLALPKEKQQLIFNAAFTEFGDHGYEQASTNRIVQAAGIGKGMLFYYFGSKLELYHSLIDRCRAQLETHMKTLLARPDQLGIIETFQYATRLKMELQLENPALFHFITRLYLNPEEVAVSEATSQNFQQLTALRERVMGELFIAADTSRLRPDIPRERLIRYLGWAMEGYTQHIINVVRAAPPEKIADLDMTRYWAEYDTYTEDLKTLFYQ